MDAITKKTSVLTSYNQQKIFVRICLILIDFNYRWLFIAGGSDKRESIRNELNGNLNVYCNVTCNKAVCMFVHQLVK